LLFGKSDIISKHVSYLLLYLHYLVCNVPYVSSSDTEVSLALHNAFHSLDNKHASRVNAAASVEKAECSVVIAKSRKRK